jgi:ATP-dependent RNA helicase SUPV3L1/SUV3
MHGLDSFPARVKAVLGPTNTGKTHLAIERMLGHASGSIGFPLRLLARENYDRMVARPGLMRDFRRHPCGTSV